MEPFCVVLQMLSMLQPHVAYPAVNMLLILELPHVLPQKVPT